MKKTLLLTLPICLLASQSNIEKKIINLENEVKTLKKEIYIQQKDLNERMPIIENNEKHSILDKINFSPEILLRFDKVNYTTGQIEGENTKITNLNNAMYGEQRRDEFTKNFDIAASLRFRLNMDMELDDIKFYGRMLYMNSTQSGERICILSRDIKTGVASSAFDIDRAYVDYTPNKNSPYAFTFSFGILPTSGGTPMQYAQDRERNSMFPALVFDMNTYGMIATQKLADDTYMRVILAKPYTLRANFYPYQCNRENIDDANILGLYVDTRFSFFGNAMLSFGANILNELKAHPYLGPDISSLDSHNLGTMVTFGFGLDIEELAQTQTTLFMHTAMSHPRGNGASDDYQITQYIDNIGFTSDGRVGYTEAEYASGEMLSNNGYALYLGAKYDINEKFNLGIEYNYGSKYWYSATQGAEDMFNKLATRGDAYETYAIWKYHTFLNAKLAYLFIQEDYTGSGWHFGEPAKKDAQQSIFSISLEAKF